MKYYDTIRESIKIKEALLQNDKIHTSVCEIINIFVQAIQSGNKILFCGNGGSAADAQHLSTELSNRFYLERNPIYAEALHCNTSYITAVANDYDYNIVFSRLIEAVGIKGDVLVAISTSGRSKNIINAITTAHNKELKTIVFTGNNNNLDTLCDIIIKIPSTNVARIQEGYMLLGHIICEEVEKVLFDINN